MSSNIVLRFGRRQNQNATGDILYKAEQLPQSSILYFS